MTRSARLPYVAWALLGAASVPSLWFAWSLPGIAAMCACIALAFVGWYRWSRRGAWCALVVLGLGMGGLLTWQAATGARCPAPGTTVILREGRAAVSCTEIRASAGSMAVFFGLVAIIGAGAPVYARRVLADLDEGLGDDLDTPTS